MTVTTGDIIAVVGGLLSLVVSGYVYFLRILVSQWHKTYEDTISRCNLLDERARLNEQEIVKMATSYEGLKPMMSDMKKDISDMKDKFDSLLSQSAMRK